MLVQKVILLAESAIRPEFRDALIAIASETLALTLREPGCEAFYQTAIEGQPNKFVFFEVFSSEKDHQFHLEQDYTKRFFAFLEGKLMGPPTFTRLVRFP